jgi:predicted RNase H-like nuclease
MNYGEWKKEDKQAKKVAETKVKSAQPTTRFYFLTFEENYRQALRHEATIEVSSSQNAKKYKLESIVVKFNNVDAFYILNKHLRRIISVEIHPTMGLTHINLE